MKARRPTFLSPISNPPILSNAISHNNTPIVKVVSLQERLNSLCIRLQRSNLMRTRKQPKRFTFTQEDILKSRSSPYTLYPYTDDWRKYPNSKIDLYSARRLTQRIFGQK